ncbi:MAG: ThuA domain-containing protein [Bacteroidota bacterium]
MLRNSLIATCLVVCIAVLFSCQQRPVKLLVFSKTAGFRHSSIKEGKVALLKMAAENNWQIDTTENSEVFTEDNLQGYSTVIFLNTTGDVLDFNQQAAFERYIQAGGGFVGIHAATDTEYEWPWYGRLVGGYFDGHPGDPNVREGKATVVDTDHLSTQGFPEEWIKVDEFYDFKSMNPNIKLLVTIDKNSYDYGENTQHPVSWYHDYDGGRSFYTSFGHTPETFSEEQFLQHLKGGIEYAVGKNNRNYAKATSILPPDKSRFAQKVFIENLNEPMELDISADKKLYYVERKGGFYVYDTNTETQKKIADMPVHTEFEDGLLGLALDPEFSTNGWVYMFYSPIGEESVQHVSRFTLYTNDSLDISSEKVIIKIPVQREQCCHSAGSLEFGPDGNLFISTGDDTSPFDIKEQKFNANGFAPLNEKPGFSPWDAQKSSGNMNDLRGAILRIKPMADGTYTIPDGNLFSKDGSEGRPELYVKGCRNPFRVSIDSRRKWVYWGDVGPDAGNDNPDRGPRGHDEVNQAKKPGYFGWPYFIGNNKPYKHFNYETGVSSEDYYDPVGAVNKSPNNTGPELLPPAQPAFIWYPYAESEEFPMLKKGGRNAMAGPIYYADDYQGENKLPEYYDDKLIVYDWMRGWMFAVTLDSEGDLAQMEPFLDQFEFANPVDIVMGPEGAMYIMEYGTSWFAKNADARISRIDYARGNRLPVAKLKVDKPVGGAPLTVNLSAADSYDLDSEETLSYEWNINGETFQTDSPETTYTLEKDGTYEAVVKVIDKAGKSTTANTGIRVGNEPPAISVAFPQNKSFYWPTSSLDYEVSVTDREDGPAGEGVAITMDYLPIGEDLTLIEQGHTQTGAILNGKELIAESDCMACHMVNGKSIGPSYYQVAERYADDLPTIRTIAGKIINGGNGNWGEQAMAAHPQISQEEAEAMATYILKIDQKMEVESLPAKGRLRLTDHRKDNSAGQYIFKVSYTDKGYGDIEPLTSNMEIRLRPAKLEAENYDDAYGMRKVNWGNGSFARLEFKDNDSWISFKDIDLTGIESIQAQFRNVPAGYKLMLASSLEGGVIGEADMPVSENSARSFSIPITNRPVKMGTLYFILKFSGDTEDLTRPLFDWISFKRGKGTLAIR